MMMTGTCLVQLVEERIEAQHDLTFDDLADVANPLWGGLASPFLISQLRAPTEESRRLSLADRLALLVVATYKALSEPIVEAWQNFIAAVEEIDAGNDVACVVISLCRAKIGSLA